MFLSVDVFWLRSLEVFREEGASSATLCPTAKLGLWIFALSASQKRTGEPLLFFDMDLKGSLSWEPRAILTFRGGASSWVCGFCSPSEVTESGPRAWQPDRTANIGPGPQGPLPTVGDGRFLTSQKSSWALKSLCHVGLQPLWPESSFCASPLTHPACQTQLLGDWEWALFLGAQEPLAPSRSLLNQFFTRNVRFQVGHEEWASGGM